MARNTNSILDTYTLYVVGGLYQITHVVYLAMCMLCVIAAQLFR